MNRIMKKSLQDIVKGRYEGFIGENSLTHHSSKVLYYGAIQSMIFAGLQSGLAALWNSDDEDKVKAETKATLRCYVLDEEKTDKAVNNENTQGKLAIFSKAY